MALSEFEKRALAEFENELRSTSPTRSARNRRWQVLAMSWWLAPIGLVLVAAGVATATTPGETLAVLGFLLTLGPSCRLGRWIAAQHLVSAIRSHNQTMNPHAPGGAV